MWPSLLQGSRRVAMEYAPRVPTRMSRGSTPARSSWFESFGVEVVSSGDLIQQFEATWDDVAVADAPGSRKSDCRRV